MWGGVCSTTGERYKGSAGSACVWKGPGEMSDAAVSNLLSTHLLHFPDGHSPIRVLEIAELPDLKDQASEIFGDSVITRLD